MKSAMTYPSAIPASSSVVIDTSRYKRAADFLCFAQCDIVIIRLSFIDNATCCVVTKVSGIGKTVISNCQFDCKMCHCLVLLIYSFLYSSSAASRAWVKALSKSARVLSFRTNLLEMVSRPSPMRLSFSSQS